MYISVNIEHLNNKISGKILEGYITVYAVLKTHQNTCHIVKLKFKKNDIRVYK